MLFIPKRETKKLSALAVGLLFGASLLFYLGTRFPYGAILQALSLLLFSAFLFLCVRYILPEYRYTLEDRTLAVIRRQGKQVQTLCRLDLSEVESVKLGKKALEKGSCHLCYNFCQNLFSENRIRIVMRFNQKRALILLDYDPALYDALSALFPIPRQDSTSFDITGKN